MTARTVVSLSADPYEFPELIVPTRTEEPFSRPTMRVGASVYATLPPTDDTGAADWWRAVAEAARLAAHWYDDRAPRNAR